MCDFMQDHFSDDGFIVQLNEKPRETNLPQEAPKAFAQAVIDVDRF